MDRGPRLSVRVRLLIIALLPMMVLLPLLIGATMQRWIWRTDQILTARVAGDLTVAREYLGHLVASTGQSVAALGASVAFRDGMAGDGAAFLAARRRALGLDFLRIGTPQDGPDGPELAVFGPAELAALSPDLPARARIARADGGMEGRGLVIRAATPVTLPDGRAARLVGGVLLNRNAGFVDRINELVHPRAEDGITTLFLEDLRIATTLRPAGAERAIGTRASDAVRARVLEQGGSWHDTAFVVNDWYISAYEPITDAAGARLGMLYTGIPRAPYAAARRDTWMRIGAAFIGVTLLTVPLFLHWARGIFRPLEAMSETMARVRAGNFDARTLGPDPASTADEIRQLAHDLDRLLDLLRQREDELRGLNADLNLRVEERTADLVRANRALSEATRQLVLSEKLATIGEVTAGIAHEINNPLAVIQGNLEVLRMVLAERTAEAATELRLIDAQIARIGALVSQLLHFSRPDEASAGSASCDPGEIVAGLEALIQHLSGPAGVTVATDVASTAQVAMAAHDLQQVLVNLATNAVQAMPEGGQLRVSTADAIDGGRSGVRIRISDTGEGMGPDTRARIFDPFFTTRGLRGTGLGLSICQTLVTRRGGELRCDSRPGEGTVFTLWLPAAFG